MLHEMHTACLLNCQGGVRTGLHASSATTSGTRTDPMAEFPARSSDLKFSRLLVSLNLAYAIKHSVSPGQLSTMVVALESRQLRVVHRVPATIKRGAGTDRTVWKRREAEQPRNMAGTPLENWAVKRTHKSRNFETKY